MGKLTGRRVARRGGRRRRRPGHLAQAGGPRRVLREDGRGVRRGDPPEAGRPLPARGCRAGGL